MQDASGMIGQTEARAASFPPRPSLCVGDIKRVHRKRTGTGSIYSMAKHPKHNCTLTRSLLRDRSIRWNRDWKGGRLGILQKGKAEGGSRAKPPVYCIT
ncbi:hypothetical protein Lal_00019680 [Lupinus albus]|nr:hypothetical protein Lal_00019680 [Lupinus albus]